MSFRTGCGVNIWILAVFHGRRKWPAKLQCASSDPLRAAGIAAKDAEEIRELGQMLQRILHSRLFVASDEIEIEKILPWLTTQGARLDFGETDITQRESAQRTKQRARNIARGED